VCVFLCDDFVWCMCYLCEARTAYHLFWDLPITFSFCQQYFPKHCGLMFMKVEELVLVTRNSQFYLEVHPPCGFCTVLLLVETTEDMNGITSVYHRPHHVGIWNLLLFSGGDGGGGHWLVRLEWCPARWSVCLPLLIFPCTIKSLQKFSSGTSWPGWSWKKGRRWLW